MTLVVGGPTLADDAPADFDPFGGFGGGGPDSEVTIAAAVEPGVDGKPDVLAVTAALADGWHLYSITQKPGGPLGTRITIADDSPRTVTGPFVADPLPHVRQVDDIPAWKGLDIEEHGGTVTWRAPLAAGMGEVRGSIRFQLCQDTSCLPPRTVSFIASDGAAVNKVSPKAAASQAFTYAPERSHVEIEAVFGEPTKNAGVDAVPVTIRLVPTEGWHLYKPADSAKTEIGEGKPTIVSSADDAGRLLKLTASKVTTAESPELASAGAVDGPVVLELLLASGEGPVEAVVGFQTCSDATCDPPGAVRLSVTLPSQASPGAIDFAPAKYGEAAASPVGMVKAAVDTQPVAPVKQVTAAPTEERPPFAASSDEASLSLPLAILMGLAGGLILNLMPCVLPVLGLKLMSFAQQSGRARQEVFQMNLWYCAGLFAVFFVLATAAVAANIGLARTNLGWGQQFGSVPFKVGMLGLVFAFALSFLGVWELPIPGFIGEKAGHVQSQEGPIGAFLKGVLSTILATPCSGPFLGPVFGYTLTQPTAITYVIFGSIALGMASPYIIVGIFPQLVRFLPKPGAWMETFKEILGFVMLGTVAFLFYQLQKQPEYFVPTFVMLIGIWMGCWWVGRVQERQGMAAFGHWVQGGAIAGVIGLVGIIWLGPSNSPTRESLLPLLNPVRMVLRSAGPLSFLASFLPSEAPFPWEPFSPARVRELQTEGFTVMVDFSADWCPTCKSNLQGAIETNKVHALVKKNRIVPVLADWTTGSEEIQNALERLGSRTIPLLAIYPGAKPGEPLPAPIILRDLLTESQVIAALEEAGPSCCPPPEIRAASVAPAPGR
jgi:thiol:disulfide interchange protein